MPASATTRIDVLERLRETFQTGGYDGASLADLSKASGFGKSSLYHHFPGGKEEMATAVLDYTAEQIREAVLAPLLESGRPQARLAAMLDVVDGLYCGGVRPCLLGAFALDSVAGQFRHRLAAILGDWVDAIARTLREAGRDPTDAAVRAEDTLIRIQGALVIARALGDPGPFARALAALRRELATG